jgi:hypothetical protein
MIDKCRCECTAIDLVMVMIRMIVNRFTIRDIQKMPLE